MSTSEVPHADIETFSLDYLRERAKVKPSGYFEDMVSHGTVEGESLKIHRDELAKLFQKYNNRNPPKLFSVSNGETPEDFKKFVETEGKELTVAQMSKNFASAMVEAAKTGFKKVTSDQHAQRMSICNSCQFWDGKARMGMGKCSKCGCTGAKQWLASSSCPINLWGALP
jgi:hypothetical protein